MKTLLILSLIWVAGTQLIPNENLRKVWGFAPMFIAMLVFVGAGWIQWKIESVFRGVLGLEPKDFEVM